MIQLHPKRLFQCASILFLLTGLCYIFFPSWNSELVFGDRLLKSAEPYTALLMQCLGGACILLASIFCTSAQNVTENMCRSVSAGFLLNAALKAFGLIAGWSGDISKGAYEKRLPAWTAMLLHLVFGCLCWLSSHHPALRTNLYKSNEHRTTGGTTTTTKTTHTM